jgi:hypothetical protein
MQLSASLVLYNNDPEIIRQSVTSLLKTPLDLKLFIVDNSPSDHLNALIDDLNDGRLIYLYNQGNNVGFGKAHNQAIAQARDSDYHLVMNPDIYFDDQVIPHLIDYLETHPDTGLICPKVLSPNGETQYLCKRYPSVSVLFARRFFPKAWQSLYQSQLDHYEMKDTGYNEIMEVPIISGCFMLFRRSVLEEVGYFDDQFFMYFEDYDLTLRTGKKYKTLFNPSVHIYHYWTRGAHRTVKLASIFIQSGFYFFQKHGWKL